MGILNNLFGNNFKGKELDIIEKLVEIVEERDKEIARLNALLNPAKPHPVRFDVVFS